MSSIKCSNLKNNNNNIELIRETDRKTKLYSQCIDCGLKKIEIIDNEELGDLS